MTAFSDTSLTRVLRRVKDTFVARGGNALKDKEEGPRARVYRHR